LKPQMPGVVEDIYPMPLQNKGVAMLSGILNSDKAINMNIAIMKAFVQVRRIILLQKDV